MPNPHNLPGAVSSLVLFVSLSACGPEPVSQEADALAMLAVGEAVENFVVAHATEPEPEFHIGAVHLEAWGPTMSEPEPAPEPEPELGGAPYPIVLVHGFLGFSDVGPLDYFFGVLSAFDEAGISAFAPNQPPLNTVALRAGVLIEHIDQVRMATQKQKVHLICHSQGGLDCRYAASALGYADRIANIITVATPHHGTPLADMASAAPEGLVNPAGYFMAWLLGIGDGDPPDDAGWDNDSEATAESWSADLASATYDMTSEGTDAFNNAVLDVPESPIFSVAAVSSLRTGGEVCDDGVWFEKPTRVDSLDPLLLGSAAAVGGLSLARNDGIVPTASMKHGTFLGCIPADHFDQVGQIADVLPNVISGFDHLDFYFSLVDFLREREADGAP